MASYLAYADLWRQQSNLVLQRPKLPTETRHHRSEHFPGSDPGHVQRVPGAFAEQEQKAQLGPAIAFAEGVNGVQLGEEAGGGVDEFFRSCTGDKGSFCKRIEQQVHLPLNVLGKAEHRAALGNPDRAILARPGIDILEQVAVDGTVVGWVEFAGWQGLI